MLRFFGVYLSLLVFVTTAAFEYTAYCQKLCLWGRGGNLCKCNAVHFVGKRAQITGPSEGSLEREGPTGPHKVALKRFNAYMDREFNGRRSGSVKGNAEMKDNGGSLLDRIRKKLRRTKLYGN